MYARTQDRDPATTWATRLAQYDAVCAWGIPDHALLQRVSGLKMPVFIANGDSDPMIRPHYSYLLAGLIPQAKVKIYPDSAHGFLFQYHQEFAADVDEFLGNDCLPPQKPPRRRPPATALARRRHGTSHNHVLDDLQLQRLSVPAHLASALARRCVPFRKTMPSPWLSTTASTPCCCRWSTPADELLTLDASPRPG